MAESTSQLQAKLKALTHGKVDIMLDEDTFKSTTQILREMSAAWEEMTDIERAAALELMGGKRQANILSSVITNFETVESVLETAANAEGSALEENAKWMDSIEGKTTTLKNSMQTLWNNALTSDFIKDLLDIANAFVKITDKVGLLNMAISLLVGYATISKKNTFGGVLGGLMHTKSATSSTVAKDADTAATQRNTAAINENTAAEQRNAQASAASAAADTAEAQASTIAAAADAAETTSSTAEATADNMEAAASMASATADSAESISSQQAAAANQAEATAAQQTAAANAAEAVASKTATVADSAEAAASANAALANQTEFTGAAMASTGGAAKVAAAGISGAGVAAKAASIGFTALNAAATMGVSLLIGLAARGIISGIDKIIHRAENIRKEVDELTNTYKTAKDTFSENIETLTTSSDTEIYSTLTDEFAKLAQGVDKYGNNISLTASEYERYKSICEQIVGINPSLASGYDSVTQAIGNNVDILTDLIELQEIEKRQNAQEYVADSNMEKIAEDAINTYNEIDSELKNNQMALGTNIGWIKQYIVDNITSTVDLLKDAGETLDGDFQKAYNNFIADYYTNGEFDYEKAEEKGNQFISDLKKINSIYMEAYGLDFGLFDEELLETYDISEILINIENYEKDLEQAANGLIDALLQVPLSMHEYDDLTDGEKSFITEWITNSDMFKIDENTSQEAILGMKSTIREIVYAIVNGDYTTTLSDGTVIYASDILDSIFSIDKSQIDYGKYKEDIAYLIDQLWNAIGGENNIFGFLDKNELALAIGVDLQFTDDGELSSENESNMIKRYAEIKNITEEEAEAYFDSLPAVTVERLIQQDWNLVDENNVDDVISGADINQVVSVQTVTAVTESMEKQNEILKETSGIILDNTEVTQEYKDSLIELGIAEDELNEYFDDANPLIVKNAKGLTDLVQSQKKNILQNTKLAKSQAMLQYYNLSKEMQSFMSSQRLLTDATVAEINAIYDEMRVLQSAISKYALLEQQLLGAANAYEQLEEAQQIDEENDYGSRAEELVNVLGDAFNTSQLGTEAARVAIEGLIPDGVIDKAATLDEQMQQIYDYFTGGEMSKLFTIKFDDDGGISSVEMTKENIENYVDTLFNKDYINEAGENLGSIFSGSWDEFTLNPAITSLEDFAKACNLSEEVAFAFLTELERYDIQNALGGDNISLLDQLMGDDPEYQIYKTTSAIAELQYQLANGQISVQEYQNAMGGLEFKLMSGQITQEEYDAELANLNQQLEEGTITAYEYEKALNGLNGVQEENGKNTADRVTQWKEANDKVNELTAEYEAAVDELERLNNTDGVDPAEYQAAVDNVNQLSTDLTEALAAKVALGEEPTVVEIQYALDTIDNLIAEWQAQNPELYATIKGSIVIDEETGEYTVDQEVYATLNPGSQALVDGYLTDLNNRAQIEVMLTEGQEDAEAQIQQIQTAAEAAQAAIEAIPSDVSVNTSSAVSAINAVQTSANNANNALSRLDNRTVNTYVNRTVTTTNQTGSDDLDGTAHYRGTAFKSGSWGAPKTETALVGEVGPELLVRGNRWTTIGANGAEFTKIKKGDVIFNHQQTRDLLAKGYITGRGKLKGGSALASGTAYASIDTWDFAHDRLYKDYNNSNLSSAASDLSSAASDLSDAADEFEETFDWIEVRLEELDETLSLLSAQIENASNYSAKNSIVDKMIGVNETKMSNLKAGIEEYAAYASKLLAKVPEKYKQAAQDGAIAITEFAGEADEKTVEAINNYREWAQKVADLRQQLEEVQTEIRDLARQKFDNVYDAGDVRATVEDSQTEKLQDQVDLLEEMGEIASAVYYGINGGNAANSTGMFENSYKTIEYLTKTRKEMQKVLNQAVQAGQIIRGSNEWYEMIDELYQVDSEIAEATKELEEFQNAINEIHWDNFEQLITRLDYIKNETQSLIDLMDSDDMFITPDEGRKYDGGTVEYWTEDDVKWTKEGLASMGLYAQQMEVAEYTARQYAEAIDELETQFKAGLYSENEYQEKLEELTSAQYDSIEAYYEAQDAIVELNEARIDSIKEGIEKEIEAYEELIEKKKEELDAEKDLYDFQKSTMEQQKNIADIERKLAALANDNSLSAAAKRKQLEAELAEAQYELQDSYYNRSVEDKQNALDKELEDFQAEKDAELLKLEEYLTNVELVIADSLNVVQANAVGIYDTLNAKAQEYDLTLSDAVMAPWQDGALAVSDYQTSFDTAMSSTMDQLEALKAKWQEVIDTMAKVGEQKVDAINKENAAYAAATKKEPPKKNTTTTNANKNQSSSQTKAVAVGSMIDASGAKIYGRPGGSGSKQYFSSDPKYVVIGESGDYWRVRWHGAKSGSTGWFRKSDVKAYAKGSTGVDEDQWALLHELGEELVLSAGPNGKLQYITRGTSIIPHDISENLMKLGQLDPSDVLKRNTPRIGVSPSIMNSTTEINMSIAEVVHIDTVTNDTIPDLTKAVRKEMDSYMVKVNNAIKAKVR